MINPLANPPPGSVEVALTHVAVDADSTLRFVAELTNTGSQPSLGVRTHWRAWTADGRCMGGHTTVQPDLPPGATHPYVGGAGADLLEAGVARLEVEVDADAGVNTGPAIGSRHLLLDPVLGDWCTAVAEFATEATPPAGTVPMASVLLRGPGGRIHQADFTEEVLPSRRRAGLWQAHFDLFDCSPDTVTGEAWLWWSTQP